MLKPLDSHLTQNLSFLSDQCSKFLPHFNKSHIFHWETAPLILGCWLGWWLSVLHNDIEDVFVVGQVKN